MSLSLTKPNNPCFVADGVEYVLVTTGSDALHKPRVITFQLSVLDEGQTRYETKTVNIVSCPNLIANGTWDEHTIDLSDILKPNTYRYKIAANGSILGAAIVKLTKIDGTDVDLDTNHFCLPGTSSGLKTTISDVLPDTEHPFLVARGNEHGSLHFYRSELEEMEYIYAIISTAYADYAIETDNRDRDDQKLFDKIVANPTLHNLIGIWLSNDIHSQYAIYGDANALFLLMENYGWHRRGISIDDDPITDEIHLIRWTNSMGALEVLLLTGEMQDVSEVEEPELYISSQSLRSTIRKQKRRSVITTKYTLQTGYLTPARIIALFDMISSDEVELKIDDEWIPVSVTADAKHAVRQREPENFELTIEVLEQTRYHKPNRTVNPLPGTRAGLLQDNSGNLILDNNSNTIQENG